MQKALGKVGSPYRYGAAGPNAFDCSGLVNWAYKGSGKSLAERLVDGMDAGNAGGALGTLNAFPGGGVERTVVLSADVKNDPDPRLATLTLRQRRGAACRN